MKTTSNKARLFFSSITALAVGMASAADQSTADKEKAAEAKTPLDQSNRPEDLKVTQDIRKAVIADETLSMAAKNVKIITAEGKVTLRGSVNSAEEKKKIVAYAKQSAGTAEVVNQIEVKDAAQ